MQLTIYYTKEDQYLLEKIEEKADAERRSKSAVILAIIEEYFEADKKVGEILCDLGKLTQDKLRQAAEIQKREGGKRKLGQILLAEKTVTDKDLRRALAIQSNSMSKSKKIEPAP